MILVVNITIMCYLIGIEVRDQHRMTNKPAEAKYQESEPEVGKAYEEEQPRHILVSQYVNTIQQRNLCQCSNSSFFFFSTQR
jgi:hypothetical protein